MNITKTDFEDLYLINYNSFTDLRGEFVKTIHDAAFESSQLDFKFHESFYSISHKNVIRGMHFQSFPNDHCKLVYLVKGAILDVVIDLRSGSSSFGQFYSVELNEHTRQGLYIGKGFAHGFLSLTDDSLVEYHTTTAQSKDSENGIKWNSFGFDWGITDPIISERDNNLSVFDSQYKYFI
ncbi:dTDP-4-dehydrorhamnose 3,5-epimerase [Mucilaginibacter terrae]|uniref:dTDP-4-dehydrorhamnose 3,5-epimerase n=1 Tax=Mucilaginibacter terrae TaxID=1955052 RepID=UPI0036306ECE